MYALIFLYFFPAAILGYLIRRGTIEEVKRFSVKDGEDLAIALVFMFVPALNIVMCFVGLKELDLIPKNMWRYVFFLKKKKEEEPEDIV